MKKFLLPLLINLYLIQATLFLIMRFENFKLFIIPGLFIILAVVLAFINIGCAIFVAREIIADKRKRKAINRTVLLFKLLAIPFYAINYIIWTFMTGLFIVMPGNIFFLIFIVPIGIGFAFVVLLAASSYSIVLLFALKKNGEISLKKFIIHTFCQLIFVVDVIDQIFIMRFTKLPTDSSTL